jgi:hypothetical protein
VSFGIIAASRARATVCGALLPWPLLPWPLLPSLPILVLVLVRTSTSPTSTSTAATATTLLRELEVLFLLRGGGALVLGLYLRDCLVAAAERGQTPH